MITDQIMEYNKLAHCQLIDSTMILDFPYHQKP